MKKTINLSFILLSALFFYIDKAYSQDGAPPEVQRPDLPELTDELREKIDSYRDEKGALREELRESIAALEDPDREEIRETVQAFREENADRIASQRDLATEIREELKDVRGDRPLPPRHRPLPPEFQSRRDDFQAERQALRQDRHEFLESIKDLTGEEREAAIQAFREEQRQRLHEQKELRRELRDQIRDRVTDTGDGDGG